MAKKRRKPAPRNTHTPPDRYDFIQHCAKLLKARLAAGVYRDNPGLEAAITDFDPALALVEIAADPASTPEMRAACSAKLLPYWHREQSLLIKEAAGRGGDTSITVVVAAWAADKPSAPALPAPAPVRAVEAEIVDAEAVAHRTNSTPPTPPLDDDRRDRARMAAMNAAVTPIIEVSPRPDVPPVETAKVSAKRGLVKTPNPEDVLRKKFGRDLMHYDELTPDTSVVTDSKIFGR